MQVVVDVNNSLAVTRITFNVTVIDENQAPYFEFSKYNVSVPEDVGVGDTLAVVISPADAVHPNVVNIVRDDPDTVTSDFMITSLMLGEIAFHLSHVDVGVRVRGVGGRMGHACRGE